MVAYSIDLRERVLAAVDAGEGTQQQIARRAATGSIAPKPNPGGRKPLIQGEAVEALRAAIRENPDATLQELRQSTGFQGCLMTIWRAIERSDITRKKSRCGRGSNSTPRSSPSGRSGASG